MLAKRLKYLRKQRKMTMQQMADQLGIAKSTYAGYESGHRHPTLEAMQDIAKALNTSTDYLLGLMENHDPVHQTQNAREFLNRASLHWDGVPLDEKDMQLVLDIMERMIRDRTDQPPDKKKPEDEPGEKPEEN
ncbi:helix-turn-helix domain-containing protein [Paenibacillus eucommiae]|uniref:Transcriptional regulator with XRE-family HTH domain n=1 Tax=Paenibacillus eucommiae TaxID=1355755 RepID=A0ABS4IRT9_9BACL|nr:helix-turn-helix transcriptional regulator [Paenibacillus eucommiae]MBP1990285.1 transcriptional regulator with XRE-family HTH domain [Paenibacillus eucommiae]